MEVIKMAKTVKFTEEEMKSLKDIQDSYITIQHNFGQISVAKLKLKQQVTDLEKEESRFEDEFSKVQSYEQEIVDGLTTKYGEGHLNPQTGEFTITD